MKVAILLTLATLAVVVQCLPHDPLTTTTKKSDISTRCLSY
jgi:hypothetical protein